MPLLELEDCITDENNLVTNNIDDIPDDISIGDGEIDVEVHEPKIMDIPKNALKIVENEVIRDDRIRDLDDPHDDESIIPKTLRKKDKITKDDIEVHEMLQSKYKEEKMVEQVMSEMSDPETNDKRHVIISHLRGYLADEYIPRVADLSIIPDDYEALPYETLERIEDMITQQLGRGASSRMLRGMANLAPGGLELIANNIGVPLNGFASVLGGDIHYQASVSEAIIKSTTETYTDPFTRIMYSMGLVGLQVGAMNMLTKSGMTTKPVDADELFEQELEK